MDKIQEINWEVMYDGNLYVPYIISKYLFWEPNSRYIRLASSVIEKEFLFLTSQKAKYFGGYYEPNDMKRVAKEQLEEFSDKEKYQNYIGKINELYNRQKNEIARLLSLEFQQLSNSELLEVLRISYEEAGKNLGYYLITQPHRLSFLEDKLTNLVKERVGDPSIAGSIINIVTSPGELSYLQREELAWNKFVIEHYNTMPTEAHIDRYLDKYGLTQVGVLQKAWDKEFIKNRYAEYKLKDMESLNAQVENLSLFGEKSIKEKENTFKIHDLGDNCKYIASQLSELAKWRMALRELWSLFEYIIYYKLLTILSEKNKIDLEMLRDLIPSEIVSYVNEPVFRQRLERIVESRRLGAAFILHENNLKEVVGEKGFELTEAIKIKMNPNQTSISGNIAYPGFVDGVVVNLDAGDENLSEKMSQVTKNNIIVATQTAPLFMPAIHKCTGIITNEGGITSHAAIVARELKIPCIVGTKHATRIFKDGDRVELDANNGIAKKL